MGFDAYSWVGVGTEDFDSTILFFKDIVGLPLARRKDESQHALFRLPSGQDFEVFGPRSRWYHLQTYPVIGFETTDIQKRYKDLKKYGVEFASQIVHAPGWGMFCYFRGPDGYLYEIVQRHKIRRLTGIQAISGYSWIGICTTNYTKAVRFFTEVIALSLKSNEDGDETAIFQLPSGQLFEIFGPGSPLHERKYMRGPCVSFEADNLQILYNDMVSCGVHFVSTQHSHNGSAHVYFFGPDGQLYAIQQRGVQHSKHFLGNRKRK
jgi:catechol 2,3-dioxygenase-like lactoylglutathione lyase family enzyme